MYDRRYIYEWKRCESGGIPGGQGYHRSVEGTLECLEVNLSQERDANEGLNLTIEALRKENENLQERAFQLEAEIVSLKQEAKDSEDRKKDDAVPPSEIRAELEKKLGFYYKDLKNVDEKISPPKTVRLCIIS